MKLLLAILALGTVGSLQAQVRDIEPGSFEEQRINRPSENLESSFHWNSAMLRLWRDDSFRDRGRARFTHNFTTPYFSAATPRIEAIHLDQAAE